MTNQLKEYLFSVAAYVKDALVELQRTHTLNTAQMNEVQRLNQLIIAFERCLQHGGTLMNVVPLNSTPDELVKPYYDYLKDVCQYMTDQQTAIKNQQFGQLDQETVDGVDGLVRLTNGLLDEITVKTPPPIPAVVMPLIPEVTETEDVHLTPADVTHIQNTQPVTEEEIIDDTTREKKQLPAWLKPIGTISTVLFYGILLVLIAGFLLVGEGGNSRVPANAGGFSIMTILTGSMEGDNPDSLPRRSVVILRRMNDADDYEVGMVATYVLANGTTWTHRIVDIIEDHEGTGERAFRLQGDANAAVDRDIITEDQMLGRIIWHSLALGQVIYFVQATPLLSGLFVLLLMALVPTVRKFLQVRKEIKAEERQMVLQD